MTVAVAQPEGKIYFSTGLRATAQTGEVFVASHLPQTLLAKETNTF